MISYLTHAKRLVFIALFVIGGAAALAYTAPAWAQRFGEWRVPLNVETIPGTSAEFNSPFNDGCPILAPDGLSLYMASNRTGGRGGLDIWVARRPHPEAPWGAPVNLGEPVNSEADDFCPTPTKGNRLFFVSARPGGLGQADMYVTYLRGGRWEEPRNLGPGINSAGGEASPSYFEDENGFSVLYFSSNRAGGFAPDSGAPDSDIYFSADFGAAQLAPNLNTELDDSRPNVRSDGREVVFDSNRISTFGGPDIYAATRADCDSAWSAPVNLGFPINTAASETRASLSRDGKTLHFGSNRQGSEIGANGAPSGDIYVSTRKRRGFNLAEAPAPDGQ
jgi:Tol biopolymer transport system component